MRKVLFYIEPHPIRNRYDSFFEIGKMFADIVIRSGSETEFVSYIFSNDEVVDRLIMDRPAASIFSLRPTRDEMRELSFYDDHWNGDRIEVWKSLVDGRGLITDFYESILTRLHSDYSFDAIVIWSENGAVKRFSERNSIPVLYGELGPTRAPYVETVYFDPRGTNGNVCFKDFGYESYPSSDIIPALTWVGLSGIQNNNPTQQSVADSSLTVRPEVAALDLSYPYVFIPLQLEDDLNTLVHSRFSSIDEFLQEVIPLYLNQGLSVVIKEHPGSQARSWNMVGEARAVRNAQNYGDGVFILPKDMSPLSMANVIAQSAFVCTINSSVGYEAMLQGKKVVLAGRAAYDIGDLIYKADETHPKGFPLSEYDFDRMSSILNRHFFIPKSLFEASPLIYDIIMFVLNTKHEAGSKQYFEEWVKRFDFGSSYAVELLTGNIAFEKTGLVAFVANPRIFAAKKLIYSLSEGIYYFRGYLGDMKIGAFAILSSGGFEGEIEDVRYERESRSLSVKGWAIDRITGNPPMVVLLCAGRNVVSKHRVIVERRDIVADGAVGSTKRVGFSFVVALGTEHRLEDMKLGMLSASNSMDFWRLEVS